MAGSGRREHRLQSRVDSGKASKLKLYAECFPCLLEHMKARQGISEAPMDAAGRKSV